MSFGSSFALIRRMNVLLWVVFFGLSLELGAEVWARLPSFARESSGAEVKAAENLFHELEETLASGLIPADARWEKLRALAAPWNRLAYDSLTQLRSEGGAVIPTLRRFRELARRHFESLGEARARSSQALAQAVVCGALAPVFSIVLRWLLPEVEGAGLAWWGITGVALALGLMSGAWIWKMVEAARWGGLAKSEREWMLSALVFGERLLALLRLGRAPDRAWTEALPLLPPALIAAWGNDPWKTTGAPDAPIKEAKNLRAALLQSGMAYKKSIQASLWDGQPCTERIESAVAGIRSETRSFQERELQLLPTRALKPLFLLTAPGILAILGFALFLSVSSAIGS
jgi:hypothetical protein